MPSASPLVPMCTRIAPNTAMSTRADARTRLDGQNPDSRGVEVVCDHRYIAANELQPFGENHLSTLGLHPLRIMLGVRARACVPHYICPQDLINPVHFVERR